MTADVTLHLVDTRPAELSRGRTINLHTYDVYVGDTKIGTVASYVRTGDLTPYARTRGTSAPRKAWRAVPASGRSATKIIQRQTAVDHLLAWHRAST